MWIDGGTPQAPVADFVGTPTSGSYLLDVAFTDLGDEGYTLDCFVSAEETPELAEEVERRSTAEKRARADALAADPATEAYEVDVDADAAGVPSDRHGLEPRAGPGGPRGSP